MSLFKNTLKAEESLFLNPIVLDYDHLPKELPFRENQQHYIATCIKPLFSRRNGKNLLILGKPGIGKTAATRFVFKKLKEETDDIIPIYINCWKKDTPYKIVLEICNQINYPWTQKRKTEELFNKVVEILNKKSAVFCFDEIDKLEDTSILYSILEDIYKKTILLITNEESFLVNLDQRIKSRLMLEILKFEPYNFKETEGILEKRKDFAFVPNSFDKQAFDLVAEKTFSLEDIRAGLFLLKESANIAENKSLKKITLEHSKQAIKNLATFKIKTSANLEKEQKNLLNLIENNSGLKLIDLFNIYKEKNKISYRTFHRKIKDLEKKGQVTVKRLKDAHGKSFIVYYGTSKRLTEF